MKARRMASSEFLIEVSKRRDQAAIKSCQVSTVFSRLLLSHTMSVQPPPSLPPEKGLLGPVLGGAICRLHRDDVVDFTPAVAGKPPRASRANGLRGGANRNGQSERTVVERPSKHRLTRWPSAPRSQVKPAAAKRRAAASSPRCPEEAYENTNLEPVAQAQCCTTPSSVRGRKVRTVTDTQEHSAVRPGGSGAFLCKTP